jgi:Dienelactone hydrolase family
MSATSPLPPITDYSESGPFETVVNTGVGPGGAYTVYRPETLGEDGFLHAPIIFGPGIGQQVSVHTAMLTIFASHGFVVVGTPVLDGGPGAPANTEKMMTGLDWILDQNDVAGTYQGKLDVTHAVSMGFSVGGTSAVVVGGHEAVATVVSIHGHTAEADLHGTMLQTTGTQDTVGMPLQQATYEDSQVPTFLATLTGAPHGYIEQNAGGEERKAIVAWMRYWIYADTGARDYFFGEDCKLCKAPWENPQRKNWDE